MITRRCSQSLNTTGLHFFSKQKQHWPCEVVKINYEPDAERLATLPITVGVLRTPEGLAFVNKLDNSLKTLELIGNRDDALEIFDMEIDPRNNSRVISGKDVETISELAKVNWPPEYLSAEDVKHGFMAFGDSHEWVEGERHNGLGLE